MREETEAVFLYIAELNGSFVAGNANVKMQCGQEDYINNVSPRLNLDCEEDRKSQHEVIWLDRLYDELDRYFILPVGSNEERRLAITSERYRKDSYKWTVPIEVDASALT